MPNILKDLSTESFLVINFSVIIIFSTIMLWLFWIDFSSYKNGKHKDCKSILVSTGVLGTFVGIFIGLLGFDSSNVSDSVQKLLDGLKTAFITSILGMTLAIVISIFQKRKEGDNAEDEMTALNNISEKLTNLNDIKTHTENLPLIPCVST